MKSNASRPGDARETQNPTGDSKTAFGDRLIGSFRAGVYRAAPGRGLPRFNQQNLALEVGSTPEWTPGVWLTV
jgi:hypothetical protein